MHSKPRTRLMKKLLSYIEVVALAAIFGGVVAGNIWLLFSWQ
jgi:hypothetical protein